MMITKEIKFQSNQFLLSFSKLDIALAFAMMAALQKMISVPVLLIVIILFFYHISNTAAVSAQENTSLSKDSSVGKLIIRNSSRSDLYVHSIPFLSALYVPKGFLTKELSAVKKGMLAHELGHVGQYDFAIIWLLFIGFISWLVAGISSFFRIIFGTIPPIESRFDQTLAVSAWSAVFVIMCTLALSVLFRVLHRREHIADFRAINTEPASTLEFLKRLADLEKFVVQENAIASLWSKIVHPSAAHRLSAVLNGYPTSKRKTFLFALLWSAALAIFIAQALMPTPTEVRGRAITIYGPPVLAAVSLPVTAWAIASATLTFERLRLPIGENHNLPLIGGIWIGFSLVGCAFWSLDFFAAGWVIYSLPDMLIGSTICPLLLLLSIWWSANRTRQHLAPDGVHFVISLFLIVLHISAMAIFFSLEYMAIENGGPLNPLLLAIIYTFFILISLAMVWLTCLVVGCLIRVLPNRYSSQPH